MESGQSPCHQLKRGSCLQTQSLTSEKTEERYAYKNDLVIASKYEALFYNLNPHEARHWSVRCRNQSHWKHFIAQLLTGRNSTCHKEMIPLVPMWFQSLPGYPLYSLEHACVLIICILHMPVASPFSGWAPLLWRGVRVMHNCPCPAYRSNSNLICKS